MVVDRVVVFIFIICLVAIGLTILIGMLTKGKKIFKFIPSIISALSGIGLYIKSMYFASGFQSIGYILLAIGAGIFAFTALVTAVIQDIIFRRNESGKKE